MVAEKLKRATQTLHQEVESSLGIGKMKAGTFGLADYARILSVHLAVWSRADYWLAARPEMVDERAFFTTMITALRADLNLVAAPSTSLPPAGDQPPGAAFVWGATYVLRGSTLGGRIIHRILLNSPALAALPALHFYEACAKLAPGHWSAFIRQLEEQIDPSTDYQECLRGAEQIYRHYLAAGASLTKRK